MMANQGKIRVRIAPAPTGPLHVGTARTALFNYLYAKQHRGAFIIRIEDTDPERSKKKWERDILENLTWLGLEWDEGPTLDSKQIGNYGPYRQSRRSKIYSKYLKKLLEEEKAYRCFCSPEKLEAQRERQIKEGEPPRYTGKCRNLSSEQVQKYLKQGKSSVIRLKNIDQNKKIVFKDMIRGKVEFESNLLGDFSLAKSLERPLYNFAVVVDDYQMKISHVIRGEDHISNTPKQILVQQALDLERPNYAHLPLILGSTGEKLSKRHGAVAISDYRKEGYLPQALVNFMAFLGWNPGTKREIYSLKSLIKDFSLDQIQKGGSQFNLKKLKWFNGFYIRKKPIDELTELCIPYLIKANLIERINHDSKSNPGNFRKNNNPGNPEQRLFDEINKFRVKDTGETINISYLKEIIALYQERLKKLSEVSELVDFFFKEKLDYSKQLLKWKDMSNQELKNSLDILYNLLNKIDGNDWSKSTLNETIMPPASEVGDRGKLLWPLRVALTGKEASAGPFEIAAVLGKEKTLARVEQAIQIVKGI